MTASDMETALAVVLAEDFDAELRRMALMRDLAQVVARNAPTAEMRTAARLRVLAYEKAMGSGRSCTERMMTK